MQAGQDRDQPWRFPLRGVHLLLAGSLLAVTMASYVLWFSYQQLLTKAATDSANMAAMIEARFDATLRRVESVLEISTTLPPTVLQSSNTQKFKADLEAKLAILAHQFPEVVAFTMFDAEGDSLYSSQLGAKSFSIKNRPYFQQLKSQASVGMLIPDVLVGVRNRQPLLLQVWPRRDAAGRLLGVTLASIDLLHFQRQLSSLDIGPNGLIFIRRTEDGRLIVRQPEIPEEINKPVNSPLMQLVRTGAKAATARQTSPVDGINRTFSVRALDSYPFFIGVAIADQDALASWKAEAGITATLVTLLLIVAWWYYFRLTRDDKIRLRLIAEREAEAGIKQERAQQTQAILDNVVDGIVTIDEAGTVQSFNKSAERIFGYTAAEVIGRNVNLLMPEPYHSAHDGYLENYRQSGVPRIIGQEREVQGRRQDGSTFPMDLAVSRSMQNGRPLFIGLVRDITERKRIDKMKAEFVSTVSHELRTPLTSIGGALGLVCGGALGPVTGQAKSMLDIAYKNSQRLTHLINDLLDMEKLAAGKMNFDLQAQEIMPLVEQTLESTQAYAEQYQVRLVLKERAEGVRVRVDARRLQQVLSNFISNAAKFSPQGSEVEVVVRQVPGAVRVEVIDHGAGIPEEFKGRIFQKFSQADSSDTRQKGGTGLGLAISKELIERMNGLVGFESHMGQGSRFYLELPT